MKLVLKIIRSLLFFLVIVSASWVLVHLLAVFGVFLAIAYPVWWVLSPQQTRCFVCKTTKHGAVCLLCQRKVNKEERGAPKTLLSAFLNAFIILILSVISIGLVFLEGRVLFQLGFPSPPKTVTMSMPSSNKQHAIGEIFSLKLEIVGIKESINSVRMDFAYNPANIEVVDISTKGSFATIFIEKEIDNKGGYARIAGGLPSPGFFREQGTFATVYFRGLKPGIAIIDFLPSSIVLANNGRGDNVLSELDSIAYFIVPRKLPLNSKEQISSSFGVLGDSEEPTQMIFYEDEEVLGSEAEINSTHKSLENKKTGLLGIPLSALGKFDIFIIKQWNKLF